MTNICDNFIWPPPSSSEDATVENNEHTDSMTRVPLTQKALVLYCFKQQYVLDSQHAVPVVRSPEEILIHVESIGLNPIDWKAP
jgi:hypothetical protein